MKNNKQRGISLIVLVITIIVMITLAGVIMLSLNESGIIGKTEKAVFMNDLKAMETELSLYLSNQLLKDTNFDKNTLNKVGNEVLDIFPNMSKNYIGKVEIYNGKLIFSNGKNNENEWAEELGYKIDKLLEAKEVLTVENTIASKINDIKIYGKTEQAGEATVTNPVEINSVGQNKKVSLYVTENLIKNGFGELGDNTNFNSLSIDKENKKLGYLSFLKSNSSYIQTLSQDEYIPVDVNKEYTMSAQIKSSNDQANYYMGYKSYDIDKKEIISNNYTYLPNTLTTLAEDLNNGDTVVKLTNISGWNDTTTAFFSLGFIFWNYVDSTGYQYPELTYSKNVYYNLFENTSINKNNNTITLKEPWNKGKIPKGTKLSQPNQGTTFSYLLMTYVNVGTDWIFRSSNVTGLIKNGDNFEPKKFRPGTKYIKMTIFNNFNDIPNTTTWYSSLRFSEKDKYEIKYDIDLNGHEPLRSLPDGTADYIDFKKGKIIRKVGKGTFSGGGFLHSEEMYYSGNNIALIIYTPSDMDVSGKYPIMSNRFTYQKEQYTNRANKFGVEDKYNAIWFWFKASDVGVIETDDKETRLTKIREYIKTRPVEYTYKLKKPVEEDIVVPTVYSLDGNTTLTSNDEIMPLISARIRVK